MLRTDIIWPQSRQYESNSEWEPASFFSDCLCNSVQFDLMLGFFSSSAIRLLSDGFALFLHNGGKMRLIINNILNPNDKKAIIKGSENDLNCFFDLSDLANLKSVLSKNDNHFFECLAWLISEDKIEIKIIAPKNDQGIAHTKTGLFSDNKNQISFNGSCNFSSTALIDNIESIDVNCDWDGEISVAKLQNTKQKFDKIFYGTDQSVNYLEPDEIKTNILENFGGKNINDLLEIEKELLLKKPFVSVRNNIIKSIEKAQEKINELISKQKENSSPKFPYEGGPRDYQIAAFENWKNNKQKGLFAMATGTGKTITSLNCLLNIYKKTGYYKAIIIVPTITLVNQWEDECIKFNFNNIIKVYSKNLNWRNDIGSILLNEKFDSDKVCYVIITTYASFVKNNIFKELNSLSSKALLIADECHNLGSPSIIELLPSIVFKRRIGLSATPERQFDDEGNNKIYSFFNNENLFSFEYSMKDAIDKGVLCRYYYYPHLVTLTDKEMDRYLELSEKIAKFYNSNKGDFKKDEILTKLLLARKRIIHKAKNKIDVFKRILNEVYHKKKTLAYTLIYVPEGNEPDDYYETDYPESNEDIEDDNDALHLIDVYTKEVKNIDSRVTVRKFTSDVKERDEILNDFSKGDIQVLTSMKCLDEGVDVPRSELAIFCSSTGNPRQFIQRRGRILRTHKDKSFSYIHDLVVIPKISTNYSTYLMERNLLKKEIERVYNFASLSENSSHTLDVLFDIMNYYNLNLYKNE